eukprot:Amastigsp_a365710_2.p2 type:complete len:130 gc:universal Amastigsp_a365710_2:403-14(-)
MRKGVRTHRADLNGRVREVRVRNRFAGRAHHHHGARVLVTLARNVLGLGEPSALLKRSGALYERSNDLRGRKLVLTLPLLELVDGLHGERLVGVAQIDNVLVVRVRVDDCELYLVRQLIVLGRGRTGRS